MVSTEPSLHMEVEGEDEFREEYACPFCSDYFDILSLCCHIDEDHPMDTINGVKQYQKSNKCLITWFLVD